MWFVNLWPSGAGLLPASLFQSRPRRYDVAKGSKSSMSSSSSSFVTSWVRCVPWFPGCMLLPPIDVMFIYCGNVFLAAGPITPCLDPGGVHAPFFSPWDPGSSEVCSEVMFRSIGLPLSSSSVVVSSLGSSSAMFAKIAKAFPVCVPLVVRGRFDAGFRANYLMLLKPDPSRPSLEFVVVLQGSQCRVLNRSVAKGGRGIAWLFGRVDNWLLQQSLFGAGRSSCRLNIR
ncbi:hypothetical protein R1sor_010755 [Riccia sorocarpa]|uniref:Secreted protein n=1 Tax=Riccia sorocarpa TaxID=122646 RepID=A0ABD3I503_9MARC